MITASELAKDKSVKHGFFTRRDGVSSGIFAGLNCGYGSGDDPSNIDRNRAVAMAKLGLGREDLNTIYQIHSADVVVASKPWALADRPRADGLVTVQPGLALGILTADCTPVLFCDSQAGVIGAAHAGWKGALGGVLSETVQKMEELGGDRSRITAAVGPCIHQPSYEVGPEFYGSFVDHEMANQRYFIPSAKAGHYLFDLPRFVVDKLTALGLAAIEHVALDTYQNEELFYSYRRATHRREADYGRGLSVIVLSGD
ncbi:MAG: peptidoglycan editing factor PgeF [Rhodospirillales bacterium]|nr:peptidoglycan editing factor PgeF [Rhodospirillales bacterium]